MKVSELIAQLSTVRNKDAELYVNHWVFDKESEEIVLKTSKVSGLSVPVTGDMGRVGIILDSE